VNPLLICIGNPFRRDDGAGPALAELLAGIPGLDILTLPGEGTELMEAWSGREQVMVADAMKSGAEPGEIRRFDALTEVLPRDVFPAFSHRFGLAEAVEMAKLLGRLPGSLILYGIEALDFAQGTGLSPPIEAAVQRLAERIREDSL